MKKTTRDRPAIRTTAELAKVLRLSRWTVSRALNGRGGIGRATRERVEKALADFQFAPSPVARALRGGRTGTVGVCLQDLESFNLTAKISSLQGRLRAKGYRVLLEFSDGAPEAEAEILNHFATMQVEGVVILAGLLARRSPAQRALDRLGIPIVPIDPREPSPRGTVWLDRGAALQAAARHLLQLGHRRFAALGIDPASYYGGVRTRALDEALSPPLAPARTSLRYFHEPDAARMDYAYGWRLAERLLAEAKRPTALIALSDTIAFGAMECLRRKHFRVPGDFSIVGYDNTDLGAFIHAGADDDRAADRRPDRTRVDVLLQALAHRGAPLSPACGSSRGSSCVIPPRRRGGTNSSSRARSFPAGSGSFWPGCRRDRPGRRPARR